VLHVNLLNYYAALRTGWLVTIAHENRSMKCYCTDQHPIVYGSIELGTLKLSSKNNRNKYISNTCMFMNPIENY